MRRGAIRALNVEDQAAVIDRQKASNFPASVSTHTVRRDGITYWLQEDVPKPVVSDRLYVSIDTRADYYDQRIEREMMEQRRQCLDDSQPRFYSLLLCTLNYGADTVGGRSVR